MPTSSVDYVINLPASALTGRTITNGIGVIDSTGVEQQFQVKWQKTATDTWNMTVNTPDGTPASFGPVTVTFANGMVVRERIVDIDQQRRRLCYAVLGDMFEHHSASMQILPVNLRKTL